MSAQVTVHRMVTTTTTSAILVNVGYLKTFPGLLKVLQILVGCVVVGLIGHFITRSSQELMVPELFFLLVATTCLICTSLLLFSCLFSIATAAIIPKTLFETLYHVIVSLLYLAASLCLIIHLNQRNKYYYYNWEEKISAAVVLLHATLTYLLLCSSINLLKEIVTRNQGYKISERGYGSKLFSGSLGLVNTVLYILSTVYSIRTFRRG